jgi:dihydrofolate synthase/folylpolyglutamate synthase
MKCKMIRQSQRERKTELNKRIKELLKKLCGRGRMEIVSKEPFLLVDGAHNSNGVDALKESLMQMYPGEKFCFFMGVMADKDYDVMIREILPLAEEFLYSDTGFRQGTAGIAPC